MNVFAPMKWASVDGKNNKFSMSKSEVQSYGKILVFSINICMFARFFQKTFV